MTIEPAAVRFTFGTSVRTWAQDTPPQPIIAKLFRDAEDPNDGLTDAVEEAAGSLMRRMARREGHTATRFDSRTANQDAQEQEYSCKRQDRQRQIMAILAERQTTRIGIVAALGISDGQHFVDLFNGLIQRGLITMTRARPRSYFTITDAGREWAAANPPAQKVAAE